MQRLALIAALALVGCAKNNQPTGPAAGDAQMAHAYLQDVDGQRVGTVVATQIGDGVQFVVDAEVIGGAGPHGFHLHEGTTCGGEAFSAAGGHFNPYPNEPHGAPSAAGHHAGDMGNVMSDASGRIETSVRSNDLTLTMGKTQAVGHPIVIHSGADDLTSQPSGNAGKKVACGVLMPGALPME